MIGRVRTSRSRAAIAVALVAVLSLLATGCLEANLNARIDADGSGTFSMEMAMSEELVTMFSAFAEDEFTSEDMIDELRSDVPMEFTDKVRFSPSSSGVGVVIEIDFADVDELNELLSSVDPADVATNEGIVTDVELVTEGDTVRFSAQMASGADLDEGSDEFAAFFGELAEPTVTFSVELPGDIGDNNADSVDGRRATWDLMATSGGRIFAESGTSSSSLLMPLLIAALAILVVVGVAGIVFSRRRGTDVTVASTGPPIPGGPPTAPTGWGPAGTSATALTPTNGMPAGPPVGPPLAPGGPAAPAPGVQPGAGVYGSAAPAPPSSPQLPALPALDPTEPTPSVPPGAATSQLYTARDAPTLPGAATVPGARAASATPPPAPLDTPVQSAPTLPRTPEATLLGSSDPAAPSSTAPTTTPSSAVPPHPPAGWYPDPGGSGQQRWWDGGTWTSHLR